jgi:hypothetical protein
MAETDLTVSAFRIILIGGLLGWPKSFAGFDCNTAPKIVKAFLTGLSFFPRGPGSSFKS